MVDSKDLLRLLADGRYHSGEEIAASIGVSRTAVWKHLNGLAELGLNVETVRGKGYRIPGGIELLAHEAITSQLSMEAKAGLGKLEIALSTDSTNAQVARSALLAGSASVCFAEHQTAGRGRRGRSWVSPLASNIYLSIGWCFDGGAEVLEGLSLAVGVAVCEALTGLGVDKLGLKWPNDVLRQRNKLAGVLIEMTGDVSGPCTAIVGVGVNVSVPASAATQIEQAWADLRSSDGGSPSRNQVASALMNQLIPTLADYQTVGFGGWRDRWLRWDAYAGEQVTISSSSTEKLTGIARGVDSKGALVLQTDAGNVLVHGGEVSMRPVQ
ncbi:MAG: bifunctional biotin--[acetyl-CoA-carboxylase] ligase/biotin operon repressor BirA [Pseudomonadota bacterium]